MARIRIVDEWLRSPVSTPSNHRAIMVVASSWSEQRVLMRAYAGSADQTRPTIVLHGVELAIGPAGTDPHGEWGIHVEPPVDGRAQELREALELAARRLAGSKGNPPRLADEAPSFENKATHNWAPGTPPATPSSEQEAVGYYEPAEAAPKKPLARTVLKPAAGSNAPAREEGNGRATPMSVPAAVQSANAGGGFRSTPVPARPRQVAGKPRRRRTGWTSPVPLRRAPVDSGDGKQTVLGFDTGGATLERPVTSGGDSGASSASLARLVGRTMPIGFALSGPEREILNALGRRDSLGASEVAEIAGVDNAVSYMEQLMTKLAEHGLDLIAPGEDRDGEPTYLLRR